MEHFPLRIKCCKCDERLDVGHKGKQLLWSDLIILISQDSRPCCSWSSQGVWNSWRYLANPGKQGGCRLFPWLFCHLFIFSRLLKCERALGICEYKKGRKFLAFEFYKRPFCSPPILQQQPQSSSVISYCSSHESRGAASLNRFMVASGSLSLWSDSLRNGWRFSLHNNAPSNHLLNLGFSSNSFVLLIQHLKSVFCPVNDSE